MDDIKNNKILEELINNHWAEKALESLPDIVVVLDRKAKIIRVNKFAEKVLGYSQTELSGKDWFEIFVPKDEVKDLKNVWKSLIETNKSFGNHNENPVKTKNGKLLDVLWSNVRIKHEGKVVAILAIGQDITERKELEKALSESESKYKSLVERAKDGIIIIQNSKLVFINPEVLEIFGYKENEMLSKSFESFLHKDYKDFVKTRYKKRMSGQNVPSIYETVVIAKNGTPVVVELNAGVIDYHGEPADLVLMRDITERKRTEKILEREKILLEKITFVSPIGIVVTDKSGNITFANNAAQNVLGLTFDKISKRQYNSPGWKITDYEGNFFPNSQLPFSIVKRTLRPVNGVQHAITKPSGERVLLNVNAVPLLDESNSFEGMVSTVDDVTHEVLARRNLAESQERYRGLFNKMKSAVVVYEAVNDGKNFRIVEFNPSATRIEKVKKQDVVGKLITDAFPGVIDFGLFDVIKRVWKTGKAEYYPISFYRDERIVGWRENYVYRLPTQEIVAVYDDLTEEKQLEFSLQESQKKLLEAQRVSNLGHYVLNIETGNWNNSEQLDKIFGIDKNFKRDVQGWLKIVHPDFRKEMSDYLQKEVIGKRKSFDKEYKIVNVETGMVQWVRGLGELKLNKKGVPVEMFGTIQDITDRKVFEEKLRASESLLRKIAENYPNSFMSIINKDMTVGFTSGQEFKKLNLKPKDFIGKSIGDIFGDKADFIKKQYRRVFKREEITFEMNFDGQNQLYHVVPLMESDGKINRILSVVENITQRRTYENALVESEKKFRSITENAADFIFIKDKSRRYTFVNEAMQKFLGLPVKDIVGKTPVELFGAEQAKVIKAVDDASFSGKTVNETRKLTIGDKDFFLSTMQTPLDITDGRVMSIMGIVRDVTNEKISEEKIENIAKFPEENPNPVLRIRSDGILLYANTSSGSLLKHYNLEVGKKVTGKFVEFVGDFQNQTKKITVEIAVNEKTYLFSIVPIKKNKYINFYGRDITQRLEATRLVRESEAKYQSLFENMAAGFAFHEMVYDASGKPINYRFLEVNDEFERLTGFSTANVVNKLVTEAIPGIEKDEFDWIGVYGKVANTGESITLADQYSESLDKWYSVVAYSPKKGFFATVFLDITDRKKMEEKLKGTLDELEASNKELKRLNDFMIGRELRMRELKMRIRELEESINK